MGVLDLALSGAVVASAYRREPRRVLWEKSGRCTRFRIDTERFPNVQAAFGLAGLARLTAGPPGAGENARYMNGVLGSVPGIQVPDAPDRTRVRTSTASTAPKGRSRDDPSCAACGASTLKGCC
jgi:hypothetical protein